MNPRWKINDCIIEDTFVLGELWLPEDPSDWIAQIPLDQIGNFSKVKFGKMPKFARVNQDDNDKKPLLVVTFPNDIIAKLHPTTKCCRLNRKQYHNLHQKYKPNDKQYHKHRRYYYGIDNVPDWETNGGCILLPKCHVPNCTKKWGCTKSDHFNPCVKPTEFKMHHQCGFNPTNRICLLSSSQMIVNAFCKTGSGIANPL